MATSSIRVSWADIWYTFSQNRGDTQSILVRDEDNRTGPPDEYFGANASDIRILRERLAKVIGANPNKAIDLFRVRGPDDFPRAIAHMERAVKEGKEIRILKLIVTGTGLYVAPVDPPDSG
jgi:hypothetical protein